MFRGSSTHTIDPKGRIIIPTRFRDQIRNGGADAVMITRLDSCLYAYPLNEWDKIEKKIVSMAETSDYMRRFRRLFVGSAQECVCDKQGRVLIPPVLRKYAALEKDIVLVGALEHFEIWSSDNWEKEDQIMADDLSKEEVRNEISRLGL